MVAQPVVPATQEAEGGESPEPRRYRFQWDKIAPLHSSLGNKFFETPSQKNKKEKKSNETRARKQNALRITILKNNCKSLYVLL